MLAKNKYPETSTSVFELWMRIVQYVVSSTGGAGGDVGWDGTGWDGVEWSEVG